MPYLDSAELFELVADEPWAMFFDSGLQGKKQAASSRYDILAISPQATLVFDGQTTRFNSDGFVHKLFGDPLAILQAALPECEKIKKSAYLPGAYGYFSYDLARQYENLPEFAVDDENLPQMAMGIYHVVLVIDHKREKTRLIRLGNSKAAVEVEQRWLDIVLSHQANLVQKEIERVDLSFDSDLNGDLDGDLSEGSAGDKSQSDDIDRTEELSSLGELTLSILEDDDSYLDSSDTDSAGPQESLSWPQYQYAFERIREYTEQGDCYQVNLTKRFSTKLASTSWSAYKALRESSPAPYGCYMNLPFAQVLSNSPESFIQCRHRNVVTSPIKGTRPRDHADQEADQAVANELVSSVKDRAENLMIVDLMRNDLSRACELGSVKVPELFTLHSFANVHHLISKVVGRLKKDLHSLDLLRSCFPGGSITGAPKIRAMEIIEELEPNRRGLYCGAIGYVGADGNLETNIAIRTIVVKDGIARYSAGGGLVIDSDVEDEYQELIDKASMMSQAVSS